MEEKAEWPRLVFAVVYQAFYQCWMVAAESRIDWSAQRRRSVVCDEGELCGKQLIV